MGVYSFDFAQSLDAKPGDESSGIASAQAYLQRFGYLSASAVALITDGQFDPGTQAALRSFQRFHGLPVTGEFDSATVGEMSKPRCGFPDLLPLSAYEAAGAKWPKKDLTYKILNTSRDLDSASVTTSIVEALNLWAQASGLSFTESEGAEIEISFASGDHGDGYSFDGPGAVLAHAFFPPPQGGELAGDCHFDEAEIWASQIPVPDGRFDLMTVAAHEFGHSIGLAHSSVQGALMFPTYSGIHRYLHEDDVSGVRALYGT